jgi:serine/threonine protein kinase
LSLRRGAIVGLVGGQTAEQIIAGVVLSERLAVTMYGAIHRAQWSGQRNLRGLVIDAKMLEEAAFRTALVDTKDIQTAISLDHPNIVPTIAVEHGGPDVVVVTRGGGRYVTLQDLISAARASRKDGGKLSLPVAAAIGKSVVEGLAAAHKAKVVHGAVHPRSVLVDQDGGVRLGDFVNGRALTTAVAQGADSSLWRGLAGYLAPELVVGEDPSPAADVYAAGAMLFTMLSGEVPPGTLHVSPAVERLVQRALDTDLARRYKNANDLLENLLEAFEDDRWDLADRGEVIKAAGLSGTDTNIDDATEDLLASLGASAAAVQVTPMRPSVDLRAEALAMRQHKTNTGGNKLEALLNDLEDPRELTAVEDLGSFKRDPISELIQMDPRKREAIVQVKPRVPSLDDPDDETPLPPPSIGRDSEPTMAPPMGKRRSQSGDESAAMEALVGLGRAASSRPSGRMSTTGSQELAAMDAIANLDAPMRISGAADAAEIAAAKLEQAAKRAEAAAARVETNSEAIQPVAKPKPKAVQPIVDPIFVEDAPPVRIKSRLPGIIGLIVILGLIGGVVYVITTRDDGVDEAAERRKKEREELERKAAELSKQLTEQLVDPGTLKVKSNPPQAGVWLKLGTTPMDSLGLSSDRMHELRVDGPAGFQSIDTQVVGAHWSGEKDKRMARITVELKPVAKDKAGKPTPVKLPAMPPKPPDATGFVPGRGPIHVEAMCIDPSAKDKKPCHADVWLYIGMTDGVELAGIPAGRNYEIKVVKDTFQDKPLLIGTDEWRDLTKGKPTDPIDSAAKLSVIERSVDLVPDPNASKKDKKKGP